MSVSESGYSLFRKQGVFFYMLFFLALYVLFPTCNSSLDAYNYAAAVKYGEHLFTPHHLLYNALLYVLLYPVRTVFPSVDVLSAGKMVNALFSVISLIVMNGIMKRLRTSHRDRILYLSIIAFSYVVWRYSSENETYIIPVTFSLAGSFFFLGYLRSPNRLFFIFLSGLFASLACLIHQVQVFWWLGLLAGVVFYRQKKPFLPVISYVIPALMVPLGYLLVMAFASKQPVTTGNLLRFAFYDYYNGVARPGVGWQNFFFIILNSIRIFYQIHTDILLFVKKNILFLLPLLFMVYFLYLLVKSAFQHTLLTKVMNVDFVSKYFGTIHGLIFGLQFLFAFFSSGNIEFMVMLPYLIIIVAAVFLRMNLKILTILSMTLLVWNFGYAIYPDHIYRDYNDEKLVDYIINHPKDVFLIRNQDMVNRYYYATGKDNYKNIILYKQINSREELKRFADTTGVFYTDVIGKPVSYGREFLTERLLPEEVFDSLSFIRKPVYTYRGLYGITTVYKISYKENESH